MTADSKATSKIHEPNDFGYRGFDLGEFHFSRDEYFAYVTWPTGRHVMSVDAFLRALQRDVAWEFFYGIVNFDGVLGTMNHYGTVDLFAGRYNDAYRKAELDHVETIDTPVIRDAFAAILSDWTNEGFDPFASPEETGSAFGAKHGNNDAATRAAIRSTGCSPTSRRMSRWYTLSPASRAKSAPSTCSPTSRAPQ
jgi:hypothetical protein